MGEDPLENKSIGRRNILKSGIAATSLSFLPKTVLAKKPSRTIKLTGTLNSPVSEKVVNKRVKQLIKRVPEINKGDLMLYGSPKFGQEEKYVGAFVMKIGRDGVPIVTIGYGKPGEDGDNSAKVKENAEEAFTRMDSSETVQDYTTSTEGSVSLQSSSGNEPTFDDGWNTYSNTEAFTEGDNGQVSITGQHARFDKSADGSDSWDQWGASFNYRSTPYENLGRKRISDTTFRQDWSEGFMNVKNDSIYDSSPSGRKVGEQTIGAEVSASAGTDTSVGTAISWSYTQPDVTRTERSDQNGNDGDAVWNFDCSSGSTSAYDTTLDVTCGSVVYLDQIDNCTAASAGDISNRTLFNGSTFGSNISCEANMDFNTCPL